MARRRSDIDRKMLVGYACNADRYEDWITNPYPIQNASHGIVTSPPLPGYPQNPLQRDTQGNFLVTGHIADPIATHTASDIVLSALGRGEGLFTGVMDNTDVFFKVARGRWATIPCNRSYNNSALIPAGPSPQNPAKACPNNHRHGRCRKTITRRWEIIAGFVRPVTQMSHLALSL